VQASGRGERARMGNKKRMLEDVQEMTEGKGRGFQTAAVRDPGADRNVGLDRWGKTCEVV